MSRTYHLTDDEVAQLFEALDDARSYRLGDSDDEDDEERDPYDTEQLAKIDDVTTVLQQQDAGMWQKSDPPIFISSEAEGIWASVLNRIAGWNVEVLLLDRHSVRGELIKAGFLLDGYLSVRLSPRDENWEPTGEPERTISVDDILGLYF